MPLKTLLERMEEALEGSIIKHDYDLVVWSKEEGRVTLKVSDLRDLLKLPQFKKVTIAEMREALPKEEKRTRKAKAEAEEEASE